MNFKQKISKIAMVFSLFASSACFSQTFNTDYYAEGYTYVDPVNVQSTIELDLESTPSASITVGGVYETDTPGAKLDVLVSKIAPDGTVLWSFQYGKFDINDRANSLIRSYDKKHVIITGYTQGQTNGKQLALLLKVRISDGALIWSKSYGQTNSSEIGLLIGQTNFMNSSDNYIIVGTSKDPGQNKGIYVLEVDDNGVQVNANRFMTSAFKYLRPTDMILQNDKVIITGSLKVPGAGAYNKKTFKAEYSTTTNYLSNIVYFGTLKNTSVDQPSIVNFNSDYVITYSSREATGPCFNTFENKIFVSRFDNLGTMLWTASYKIDTNSSQRPAGIYAQGTDIHIAFNKTRGTHNSIGFLSIKGSDGSVNHVLHYDGVSTEESYNCNDMIKTSNDGYLIKGESKHTLFKLISVDMNGETSCVSKDDIEACLNIIPNYYSANNPSDAPCGTSFNEDLVTKEFKLESDACKDSFPGRSLLKNNAPSNNTAVVYPSPLSVDTQTFNIRLKNELNEANGTITVVNSMGQIVQSKEITVNKGINEYEIDASNMNTGIHMIYIQTNSGISHTLKLVRE